MKNIELTGSEILNVVRMTGKISEFSENCYYQEDGISLLDDKKVKEFFAKYNLPTNREELDASKVHTFKIQNSSNLKVEYKKGEFAVLCAGSILNSNDFINSSDRLIIVKFLEDMTFDTTITLTSANMDSLTVALIPFIENFMIEIFPVSGTVMFNPGVNLPVI